MSSTPAQVRAKYGNSCSCKGECGQSHFRGRCRTGGSGGDSRLRTPCTVVGEKQYCRKCARRLQQQET